MRCLRQGLLLTALLWLTGCAGGGPLTRYLLPGPEAAPAAPADAAQLLLIRPVELSPYLSAEGIVLQLDAVTLNAARDHQWAAPLAHQLRRGLRERLAVRLPHTRVASDGESPPAGAHILTVEVEHFMGRHDGYAQASGRWQLTNGKGELLALEAFNARSPLEADGYPALVRALGRSWDQVAEQISDAVRRQR